MMNRSFYLAIALCLPLLVNGCKKSGPTSPDAPQNDAEKRQKSNLELFVGGYHIFVSNEELPPTKPEDLPVSSDQPLDFSAYVIIWGVDPRDIADPKNTVLMYPNDVPANGGLVAFVDGSVRRVTADEFKSLPKAVSQPPMARRPAAHSFTVKEYAANGGKPKVAGKIVELKGTVDKFDDWSGGKTEIRLGKLGEDFARCVTSEKEPWARYAKGQEVTIKGFVKTQGEGFDLIGCAIVGSGPNTGVSTTADKLLAEFSAPESELDKKFSGNSCIVSGEVARVDTSDRSHARVLLKGPDNRTLACDFGYRENIVAAITKLTEGQKVRIYGEFVEKNQNFQKEIRNCRLISE